MTNFHDVATVSVPTVASPKSPITPLIFLGSAPALEADATKNPGTDKIRISPMRLRSIQASMRARVFPAARPAQINGAMHQVFMVTTMWFQERLDVAMPHGVCDALQHIHMASRGIFVDPRVLFVSLRQIEVCEASGDQDAAAAIKVALQALAMSQAQAQ